MGFVACKCPQCGADLNYDESRKIMFCQYCGSKVLKTDVNQYITNNVTNNIQADNLNVSNQLDVDTMFYNWLVGGNNKLVGDLTYYYPYDDRAKFAKFYSSHESGINTANNDSLSYCEENSYIFSPFKTNYDTTKEILIIAKKLSDNTKYEPYLSDKIKKLEKYSWVLNSLIPAPSVIPQPTYSDDYWKKERFKEELLHFLIVPGIILAIFLLICLFSLLS